MNNESQNERRSGETLSAKDYASIGDLNKEMRKVLINNVKNALITSATLALGSFLQDVGAKLIKISMKENEVDMNSRG